MKYFAYFIIRIMKLKRLLIDCMISIKSSKRISYKSYLIFKTTFVKLKCVLWSWRENIIFLLRLDTIALKYDTTREVKKFILIQCAQKKARVVNKISSGWEAPRIYFVKASGVYHRMNKQALDFRGEFDETLIFFDGKGFVLLLRWYLISRRQVE